MIQTNPNSSTMRNASINKGKDNETSPIFESHHTNKLSNEGQNDRDKDIRGDDDDDDNNNEVSDAKDENPALNRKNITERKKQKKKKKTLSDEQPDNSIPSAPSASPKQKETVFILGDSMVKKVNGFHLTKHIKHKYLVKVRPFNSAKVRCMHDHVKPTIRETNPEHIIIHVGTNDLNSEKTASEIANSIVDLANSIKNETNTIHVSLLVPRNDNLNNKANEVNNCLSNMCHQRGIKVISHTETIDPINHLNESLLHLNRYGAIEFSKNFKKFLCDLA